MSSLACPPPGAEGPLHPHATAASANATRKPGPSLLNKAYDDGVAPA